MASYFMSLKLVYSLGENEMAKHLVWRKELAATYEIHPQTPRSAISSVVCPQMGLPELFLIWHFEKKNFQSQLTFGNSGLNRGKWATLPWSSQRIPVSTSTGEFHEENGTGMTWRFLRLVSSCLLPLPAPFLPLGSYSVTSFGLVLVSP